MLPTSERSCSEIVSKGMDGGREPGQGARHKKQICLVLSGGENGVGEEERDFLAWCIEWGEQGLGRTDGYLDGWMGRGAWLGWRLAGDT